MRVPDHVKKSVTFLGVMEGGKFRPRASAFFVNYEHLQHDFFGLVTAEHVVSGLLTAGQTIYTRLNLVNGDVTEIPMPSESWKFYPDERNPSDVAVCPIGSSYVTSEDGTNVDIDLRAIALNGYGCTIATQDVIQERAIGVGDEVFAIGLFRSHYGNERNYPIVRTGNIAAMMDQPIFTHYCGYTDAYLIEAHSIILSAG